MTTTPQQLRRKFSETNVLVIGDLVADQFLHGTISRVSREAPVFILRHDETETLPGGAANAALNVSTLGGCAKLLGFVGDDSVGAILLEKLKKAKVDCGHVTTFEKKKTTTKVRVLAGQHYAPRQQVIRIDYENEANLSSELQSRIMAELSQAISDANIVVLSDYNYGVASKEIFEAARLAAESRRIPIIVDSRFRLREFAGATSATPNQDEIENLLGKDFSSEDCVNFREELGLAALLVTRGNKGMSLYEKGRPAKDIESIGSKEPVDVTGAGDTVIAAYALAIGAGYSFSEAARIANHAGGLVVMKRGTASVTIEELLASLENEEQGFTAAS
jgi:rfaE bifunctional protein kinase chain/domain